MNNIKIILLIIMLGTITNSQTIDSSCKEIKLEYDKYYKTNLILWSSISIYSLAAGACILNYGMSKEAKTQYRNTLLLNTEKVIGISYCILFFPALGYTIYINNKMNKLKAKLKICGNSISINYNF